MTDSAEQSGLEVGVPAETAGPGRGLDALAALDRLVRKVEKLQEFLGHERGRVHELKRRIEILEREKKQWDAGRKEWDNERGEVIRIVEGLILKVDSLEKQI